MPREGGPAPGSHLLRKEKGRGQRKGTCWSVFAQHPRGGTERERFHNAQTKDEAMSPRSCCLLAPGQAPEPGLSPPGLSPWVIPLPSGPHLSFSFHIQPRPRPMATISGTACISHFLSCGPLKFPWIGQTPGHVGRLATPTSQGGYS